MHLFSIFWIVHCVGHVYHSQWQINKFYKHSKVKREGGNSMFVSQWSLIGFRFVTMNQYSGGTVGCVILLSLQCSLSCFVPPVVVWSDLLGGIQSGQNTLPSHCKSWDDWLPGTRIQAKETCSLQWKYVSEYHIASWMHCYEIQSLPCFVSWSSSSVSVKVANCFYSLHKHTKEKVTK